MKRIRRGSVIRLSSTGAELLTLAATDNTGVDHRISTSGYSYGETVKLLREQINANPCACRDHR